MGVEVSRLSNGLTVATETLPSLESVALGAWLKSGARNERSEEHGMAHLLEHMAFKGTRRRSAFEIASEIEDVGGEINAATSVETTSYYARVLSDDVPLAVDILSDILQESEFDPQELEREQHVILQEIGAAHDTPDDIVFDRFTETAFRHQTIGRSILGTPETVKSFTSKQLHKFIERQYGAERMVVVAAGDIKHDNFVREVEKHLGGFRSKSDNTMPQFAQYVGGDFREDRDLMDAQIVLGFEGRAYHVRDFYASQVLSMILGGGMSSRLFQEVREKRGLCYSVYAFHWGFSDTGIFGVHAATGQSDIAELVPVVIDELQKVGENILQEELDRARAQYRAGLIMSAESPASRASQIARQMLLFGRPIAKEELMERLSALTVERLTDLSSRLFSTKPTLTAVGPVGTLAPYEAVLESLSGTQTTARKLAG
ncbi:MAG: insulinase family protein [Mesorhizobium sp.]|uniref:M16 family metallopeptidase n=1 Tax=unclassified Mesorhizobium TaxID=325217 RepID=UPI000494B7A1|nr:MULTISPECIES: pitrilysin family protein [Mesorhizobium]RUV85364.1 insulinase family protein [Mesorhizobium sp. M5C.F.Ca.IN.020.14.1.1]QIA24763.1 insulinase family protein [Mesorhizobium sp. AA22]RUV27921.1 insulinase family protein [Mesorhizobium sp. M5C.F.Ca.IN.020.32.2.1]RUV58785.1 insulinase family protein [Mesorhizobium sp. M5C.F.Ca.IN.020.29.1.1]RUV67528.1 insulinase family protein [Mesorhizobium sp. M5C.F.Cr.IN.023.01.1.1]